MFRASRSRRKIRLALFRNRSPWDVSPIRTWFVLPMIPMGGLHPRDRSTVAGRRDMSPVWAWPERLVTTSPSVARQDGQDGVVLSLAGEWIVGAGHQLEAAG